MIGDGFEFVVDFEKSHGSFVHDALTGREFLDFYSCFASSPLGFNHPKMNAPEVREAITVSGLNNITNSDLFTTLKAEFVETFYRKAAPERMPHLFLIAGGALAVENALKAAFDWKAKLNRARGQTGRREMKVIHLREAFHGRSGYTLSLTNTDPVKTDLFPKFDWPRIDNPKIVFPDRGENHQDLLRREARALEQMKHAILTFGDDVAACIVEPIQGEGGDNHFRGEFLREVQRLCNENDVMFIVDEIQSGLGITGRMWAYEHLGLEPDMLCFGKKMQVCGFVAGDRIDQVEDNVFRVSGRINSTWGGNLVDMVRSRFYIDIIDQDRLVDNAALMGDVLLGELERLAERHPHLISNVRGRGLMCAFDLPTVRLRDELRRSLFEKGVLILACGERSLRFRPLLTVSAEEIGRGIARLDEACAGLA